MGYQWTLCPILWRLYHLLVGTFIRKRRSGHMLNSCTCRSQVEINTAIICASAPSFKPLIKRAFEKFPRFQRSRGACLHHGGRRRSNANYQVTEMTRSLPHDRNSLLEPPAVLYDPRKLEIQNEVQTHVFIMHTREEEEIRARVRAFSSPSFIVSHPTSVTRPSNTLKALEVIRTSSVAQV